MSSSSSSSSSPTSNSDSDSDSDSDDEVINYNNNNKNKNDDTNAIIILNLTRDDEDDDDALLRVLDSEKKEKNSSSSSSLTKTSTTAAATSELESENINNNNNNNNQIIGDYRPQQQQVQNKNKAGLLKESQNHPQQQQHPNHPGAYAVRGINAIVPNTDNTDNDVVDHHQDQAIDEVNGSGSGSDSGDSDNVDVDNVDNSTPTNSSNTAAGINTNTDSNNTGNTGNTSTTYTGRLSMDSSQLITAQTEVMTSSLSSLSSFGPSNGQHHNHHSNSNSLLITASVVDEEKNERNQLKLIKDTEARVRREISGKGSIIVDAEIMVGGGSSSDFSSFMMTNNHQQDQEEQEQEETTANAAKKKEKKHRKKIKIASVIIALILVIIIIIVIPVIFSIVLPTKKNTDTDNNNNESSAVANNNNPDQQQSQSGEVFSIEEENTPCVGEKLQKWIELNTTLQQYFDTEIMEEDMYKTVSENCKNEIIAYTNSAEKSCQLEKQYNSPWNYGDRWLASTTVYQKLNEGSDNGAPYLDGRYRLATIFDTTVWLTELFPPPLTCYADCYMESGSGNNGCDSIYSLAPTKYDNNPYNVTTWFVEPPGESWITPEMYCNVAWESIDQAYVDLKICAAKSSADVDAPYTNDAYTLAFEYEKEEQQKCSKKVANCGNDQPLPQKECGKEKINSFIDDDSWLKQYFDSAFTGDNYKKAVDSCQNEIDTFTEIADRSCHLESTFNSSWNYGDRWLATYAQYDIMNDGSTNGAIFIDGYYMLQVVFDETYNFTLPINKPHICLADCYTGMTWNGENNTCDFYDKPAPTEFNDFGLDSLFVSQSTISVDTYCNIEWASIDDAVTDIKICAAKAVGEPFMMTHDEYVCFFEYEKLRQQKCSEYHCDDDAADADADSYSNFTVTLEDYCQISPDMLDLIYTLSGTSWI